MTDRSEQAPGFMQQGGDVNTADLLRAINAINGFVYRCINDHDWTLKFMSGGIEELSGYPPDVFLHQRTLTWGDLIHDDDALRVWGAVQAGLEAHRGFEIYYRIKARDGSVRWVHERGHGIYDTNDELLFLDGHVMNATPLVEANECLRIKDAELQDINQRLEQLVIERTARLEERERQLRRAQEIAQLGDWRVNVQNGELIWSDQIYRIFGHEPRAFSPSQTFFYDSVHPEDRERVRRLEAEAFATGRIFSVDHRIVLPDGRIRWVHEEAVSETDADGRPLYMTGTVQDVTERKQAEAEMIQAREQAEQASLAKSEFLSRMSHELRTPLNAVLGFSRLLEEQPMNDQQQDNVREIVRAGEHLLELINEILDLSSIESGRLNLRPERLVLQPVIESCLAAVRPLAEERAISLHCELEGPCVAMADALRLRQVLLNLLSNAIKYNRHAGSISVRCESTEAADIAITVSDTGIGIPAESLSRIFEPFERLEASSGDTQGTGIGLTLGRLLVEAMGGTLEVDSSPGAGSRFRVELPSAAEPARTTDTNTAIPGPEQRSDIPCKLLYVEDNPANLRLVHRILGNRPGWQVIDATDAEAGIALAMTHRPDVILMDIGLPGMDGYAALERLRADRNTAGIPVVALSANAMPADIRKGMAAGFDDYLTKPLNVPHFLSVLDEVLTTDRRT